MIGPRGQSFREDGGYPCPHSTDAPCTDLKTVSAETHGSTNQGVVQELVYHSAIAITLDTYSHVLPGMGDYTARAMQDALTPIEDALTD